MLEGNETDYYLNLGTFINPGGGGGVTPMRTGPEMFVSDRLFYCCSALKTSTLFFFFNKNVVFPAQAEYSYFSADFRLKIFLYYS